MPNRSAQALGEIIRQQRELAEYSMRQFAELAGISNPYLSQIERGLRAPSEQVLDAIAQTLKVSAETLYQQAGVKPRGAADQDSAVLNAIAQDPRLTARQRSALREIYEAFVAASPRGPAGSGESRAHGSGESRAQAPGESRTDASGKQAPST
jgi:transcriptional regulator with XRE-family HTH domain